MMKIIKDLFKRKNKKKYSKDEYIRSELIYSAFDNFIILISFSDNYYQDVANFIINSKLKMKLTQSSYEVDTGKADVDNEPITVIKNDNYLLIAGTPLDYRYMFDSIDLSNVILDCITKEIYENMSIEDFTILVHDNILNERSFKIQKRKDINDMKSTYHDNSLQVDILYDNIEYILSKLPSEFTNYDVFDIISFRYDNDITGIFKGRSVINDLLGNEFSDIIRDNIVVNLFSGLTSNLSIENIRKMINYNKLPIYKKVLLDSDEVLHGKINPSNLDQIFQQQYDRFNAIVTDNTHYVDIDEILASDDPEYNNIQENRYDDIL